MADGRFVAGRVEVGAAKPAAGIFRQALDQLDVNRRDRVCSYDDRRRTAPGRSRWGSRPRRSSGRAGPEHTRGGTTVVRSLPEVGGHALGADGAFRVPLVSRRNWQGSRLMPLTKLDSSRSGSTGRDIGDPGVSSSRSMTVSSRRARWRRGRSGAGRHRIPRAGSASG